METAMDFVKRLFRKDKSSIPMATKKIPEIEPIVIQAVENLFSDVHEQETVFKYILEITKQRKGVADPRTLLALLRYSNGNVEDFHKAA
jgi:hypothetical protein